MRFFLDNRFKFRAICIARPGGGIAVGVRAAQPILVLDNDDSDSHWWFEGVSISLLFWIFFFDWYRRIIPYSPTQLFKDE
jgi:hypothetical protein